MNKKLLNTLCQHEIVSRFSKVQNSVLQRNAIQRLGLSLLFVIVSFLLSSCTSDGGACLSDGFSCASAIELGSITKSSIATEGETDYYKLTTSQTGVLEVTLSAIPGNISLSIALYNSAKEKITSGTAYTNSSVRFEELSAANTFYITVSRYGGTPTSEQYELRSSLETSDEHELNNTFDTGTRIDLDSLTKGASYGREDIDYFTFTTTQTGVAKVILSGIPADISLSIVLYDAAKKRITSGTAYSGGSVNFEVLSPASIFFISITRFGGTNTSELYELRVSSDTSDTNELNNTFDTATTLPVSGTEQGAIYGILNDSSEDVDYFVVNTPATGNVEVTLSGVPADISYRFTLFNSSKVQVDSRTIYTGGSFTFMLSSPSSTFYLLIQRYGGTKTPNQYQLAATVL